MYLQVIAPMAMFLCFALLDVNLPGAAGQAGAGGSPAQPAIDVLIAYPSKPEKDLIVLDSSTPTVTLTRGETYDLACHFQPGASAGWTVAWLKSGRPVANSSDTHVTGWLGTVYEDYQMRFQNFSSHDAGYYTCQATDPDGLTRVSIAILQVVPEITTNGAEQNRVAQFTGQSTVLNCEAAGYPLPRISWRRKGVKISSSASLLVPNLNMSKNGTYECVAKNTAGRAAAKVELVVMEKLKWVEAPPSILSVDRGQPMKATCVARGVPTPIIEWGKFTKSYSRLRHLDGMTTVTLQPGDYRTGEEFICIARSPYPCCHTENTQTPLLQRFRVSMSGATAVGPTDPDVSNYTSGTSAPQHAASVPLLTYSTLAVALLIGSWLL